MRIVVTSDFHHHIPPTVPECDLLLIAGDCLEHPVEFEKWLLEQPARHIVGIAGNHDFIAEDFPDQVRALPWDYLENETTEAAGLKIYGSPLTPPFFDWAFMRPEHELAEVWAQIPEDVDVLLTHGPPHRILDRTKRNVDAGSISLALRLRELPQLKLLAFGHIHEGAGVTQIQIPRENAEDGRGFVVCCNGSYLDHKYRPTNLPFVIDL